MGLSVFRLGEILVVFRIVGWIWVLMIAVVRCVIWGDIKGVSFLYNSHGNYIITNWIRRFGFLNNVGNILSRRGRKVKFISSASSSSSHSIQILPYPSLPFPPLPYYIFQTFSSNLSVPSTRGGISSDLCSSNSLGTSYSRHESESEWPAGLVYLDCTVLYYTLVYIGVLYVRTSR